MPVIMQLPFFWRQSIPVPLSSSMFQVRRSLSRMLLQPSPSSVGPQDYQMSHHLTLLISLFPRKHCPTLLTNLTLTISLRTPRICGLGPSSSPLAFLMLVIDWGSFRLPIWASISWTASSVFAFNTGSESLWLVISPLVPSAPAQLTLRVITLWPVVATMIGSSGTTP